MANCQQELIQKIKNNKLDSIEELNANTLTQISFTNIIKQLLKLEIVQQETVQFSISLQSEQIITSVDVTVNFFQIINNNLVSLGSVQVTEIEIDFQKDLTAGTFYICIGSTKNSYTGTFIGHFTQYALYSRLFPNGYAGEFLEFDLYFKRREQECNKLLYFEIIDGKLPDGLEMTLTGNIFGVIPNQDCIEENDKLSPSQNWYYSLNDDGTWFPWGRQWRFKIRVWIVMDPESYDEKWFCIRVYNNWSWDRDYVPPISEEDIIEKSRIDVTLPEQLCCEDDIKPIENKRISQEPLPEICPCEEENTEEQKAILRFLDWYLSIRDKEFDSEEVINFINKFKTSKYFQEMIEKCNLREDIMTFEELEKEAFDKQIKSIEDSLINGRNETDIDYLMLQSRDNENQKLPITIITKYGSYLSAELATIERDLYDQHTENLMRTKDN